MARKLFVAKWPDGTGMLLYALDRADVNEMLDAEGDPNEAFVMRWRGEMALNFFRTDLESRIEGEDEKKEERPATSVSMTEPEEVMSEEREALSSDEDDVPTVLFTFSDPGGEEEQIVADFMEWPESAYEEEE